MEQISLASLSDITRIMELIQNSIIQMEKDAIFQWDDIYPNIETIKNDILIKSLFVYRINSVIAGIIVLNSEADVEYDSINWHGSDTAFLVIHRLTVDPFYQGKGIAKTGGFKDQVRHTSITIK